MTIDDYTLNIPMNCHRDCLHIIQCLGPENKDVARKVLLRMANGILRYSDMKVIWRKEMLDWKHFHHKIWPHVCIFCKFGFAGPGVGHDNAFCSTACLEVSNEVPREFWKD